MGDTAVFLKDGQRDEDEKRAEVRPMELDEYLDDMKGTSCYQVGLILAASLLIFSACTVTTLPIFLSGTPKFRCAFPYLEESALQNVTEAVISQLIPNTSNESTIEIGFEDLNPSRNLDITVIKSPLLPGAFHGPFFCFSNPHGLMAVCSLGIEEFNSCFHYALNATPCIGNISVSCVQNLPVGPAAVVCNDYEYDDEVYEESITTEWDLVCDRVLYKAIANSCMFLGFFLGSFLTGVVADWFGRKKTMLGAAVMTSGFGFAVAFSPNYFVYLVSFTLFSGGSIAECIVSFTYLSEISNRKQRRDILLIGSFIGSFGDIVISPISFMFRRWRYISLFCAVVPLIYLPIHFFVAESPRWLLSAGKQKSARKVIKRYFDSKGIPFSQDRWERVLEAERIKTQEVKRRKKYSILDLFKTPHVRLVSLNVMFTWFVVSIVYYGLILNIGNLAGDPYLNGFINSLLDIVACVFIIFTMRLLSKNYLLCGSFLLAGTACIASMLVLLAGHPIASVVLACIGRFAAACAYKIAYVLTTELFPTVVRSSGLSLGSGSSRIGGMISPFTVQGQESIPWLMQTVFGSLSIIAGILALAFPDTNNVGLMSTLDEAENFFAENIPRICRRRDAGMRRRFTSPFLSSDCEQGDKKIDDVKNDML